MNDCSDFQSLTLRQEDMTNNAMKKKGFEMLLVEGNILLSPNEPTEKILPGQSLLFTALPKQIIFSPDLCSTPSPLHFKTGAIFHLYPTYSSSLEIRLSLSDVAPVSPHQTFT